MPDREKVIRGLECCFVDECRKCPYVDGIYCKATPRVGKANIEVRTGLVYEAIELLKAQEPVKPIFAGQDDWICGNCGETVGWEQLSNYGLDKVKHKYCPECGKAVKWND